MNEIEKFNREDLKTISIFILSILCLLLIFIIKNRSETIYSGYISTFSKFVDYYIYDNCDYITNQHNKLDIIQKLNYNDNDIMYIFENNLISNNILHLKRNKFNSEDRVIYVISTSTEKFLGYIFIDEIVDEIKHIPREDKWDRRENITHHKTLCYIHFVTINNEHKIGLFILDYTSYTITTYMFESFGKATHHTDSYIIPSKIPIIGISGTGSLGVNLETKNYKFYNLKNIKGTSNE